MMGMISATEALAQLAKIAREKKIVNAAVISADMKKKMLQELDARTAMIERGYTEDNVPANGTKTPAK